MAEEGDVMSKPRWLVIAAIAVAAVAVLAVYGLTRPSMVQQCADALSAAQARYHSAGSGYRSAACRSLNDAGIIQATKLSQEHYDQTHP
jgi:hypothetical protein